MTVADLVHPGDKIEIRLIQQIQNRGKTDGIVDSFKSQVLDIKENGNIEIAMPIEGSKLIMLSLGARYEFLFYGTGCLYKGIGQIVERYKKDNRYMLSVELKTHLEKFQRREYYRYACTLEFSFYELTREQAALDSVEEIFDSLRKDFIVPIDKLGTVVDLSGGGAKFRSEFKVNSGQYILLGLRLTNDKMDKQYYILGSVIACYPMENTKDKLYECRVKFMIKDNKIREEIIRYIFEEERRIRQKANVS